MSDTISREKAIATVFRMHDSCDTYDITDYRDMMVEALKVLPSAQPERKKGKWIIFDTLYGDEAHCWECHRSLYVNEPGNGLPDVKELHFCPFCGADMRGEQDA